MRRASESSSTRCCPSAWNRSTGSCASSQKPVRLLVPPLALARALEVRLGLGGDALGRLGPIGGALGEERHAQILEQERAARLDRARRLGRARLRGEDDAEHGGRVERVLAGEDLVEDDAEREDVGAVIDLRFVAADLLGRDVARRAGEARRLGPPARAAERFGPPRGSSPRGASC
jgi:hypothetical protein